MACEALRQFRMSHRASHAVFGGLPWEYWAAGHARRGLLLLGSGIAFGDASHRLVSLFEHNRRVIAPSYPPAGDVDAVVEGLAALLDAEALDQVDVIGHSLGAGIAHAFVRRYPDRVGRLALSGFGLYGFWHGLSVELSVAAAKAMPWRWLKRSYASTFQRLVTAAGPARGIELESFFDELLRRHTKVSLLRQLDLLLDLNRRTRRAWLTQPVSKPGEVLLLLANDDPQFTRREQEALATSYPGAQVVRFVSSGRVLGFTRAQQMERRLELFFGADERLSRLQSRRARAASYLRVIDGALGAGEPPSHGVGS